MAFPWIALALAGSTAVSYMGSIQQSKNMAASAAWDKYHANIKKTQDTIMANKNLFNFRLPLNTG